MNRMYIGATDTQPSKKLLQECNTYFISLWDF